MSIDPTPPGPRDPETWDYHSDPRVAAASNDLWHPFKSLFDNVYEASQGTFEMAIVAVRAVDRLAKQNEPPPMTDEQKKEWQEGFLKAMKERADQKRAQEELEAAAARALAWAKDFHCDNQREVIEDLTSALAYI